jgi:hypothetical protein
MHLNALIFRWHIVIHGCIDGYSRMMTFLGASNNNRASTVLDLFVDAIAKFGVPSRVRCDHGGENVDVCLFMEVFRGYGRGSAIRGRSVHNQRIERFWVDMWKCCTHLFYNRFQFLEQEGILNPDNPGHVWCLHYVFIPRLNRELALFSEQWNLHGIRTVKGSPSPKRMYMERLLQLQGSGHTAVTDFVPPDEPHPVDEEHYGVARLDENSATMATVTGDSRVETVINSIVEVPSVACPFSDEVLQRLQLEVDPLDNTLDPYGLELYVKVLSLV